MRDSTAGSVFSSRVSKLMTAGMLYAACSAGSAFAVNSSQWSTVLPILQRNVATLTASPTQTPGPNVTSDNLNIPDGPFMGNGDVTVAVGGTAAQQTYTITTTDMWYQTTPVVIGSVSVITPGFDASATYSLQQDPGLAEVRSYFSEGSQSLQIRSITAATANLVVIQLTNTGPATINGIAILTQAGSVGTNFNLPITDGVQASSGTTWITRTTDVAGNPWVARDALAIRVVEGSATASVLTSSMVGNSLNLPPNHTINIVVGVGGGLNSTTYLADAQNIANSQTEATIATLISAHEAWWQNFWMSGATVDLGGGPVELYWYTSLYMLACANRSGNEMPGMQNIQTEDQNIWQGGWWTNYDLEDTYLGVFSANHPELAAAYDAGVNQYLPSALANAGSTSGAAGATASTTFAPGGQTRTATNYGMQGDAAFLATVFVNQWNYTRNASWARATAYPWMVAAAHWWDQHLVNVNGVYTVEGSAQNEGSSYQLNPTGDLSYLRGLYAALINMNAAGAVSSSSSDLSLWQTEVANLAPLPTFTYNGHTDLKSTQDAPGFYGGDANPVNGAVWSPVLGLGSSASLLKTLQNTIYDLGENANIWYQSNSFAWIYPAAARAGLPDTFSRFTANLAGRTGEPTNMRANGTVVQAGGGAETLGSVETVDEMLLSSYDGVLRLFPAWPSGRNGSFSNLGAVGGFVVSSSIIGGVIQSTSVVSNSGQPLTIAQPWAGATITITDSTNAVVASASTPTVTVSTIAGHTYSVTFSGSTPPLPDLAAQATAIVSSDIGNTDWWAGYANDGQTSSMPSTFGWSSSANTTVDHQEFYELDFGVSTAFNEVELWPRSDAGNVGQGFPASYNIAVSADGVNWIPVAAEASASPPTAGVVIALSAQNSRYLRITGLHLTANANDSGQYRMQFAEVGVYNVPNQPSFTMNVSPGSITLIHGGSTGATAAVTTTASNGFNSAVTFSLAGTPANLNYTFLSAGSGATLVLYANSSVSPGTYSVAVIGTGGGLISTAPLSLIIQ